MFPCLLLDRYVSPGGRDEVNCGTALLPCKSLKLTIEKNKNIAFLCCYLCYASGRLLYEM